MRRSAEEKDIMSSLGIPETEMFDLFAKKLPHLMKWLQHGKSVAVPGS